MHRAAWAYLAYLADAHLGSSGWVKDLVNNLHLCIVVACSQCAQLHGRRHVKHCIGRPHGGPSSQQQAVQRKH